MLSSKLLSEQLTLEAAMASPHSEDSNSSVHVWVERVTTQPPVLQKMCANRSVPRMVDFGYAE